MSYNIDKVTTLKLDAWMLPGDVLKLLKTHGRDLPESSFLHAMREKAIDALTEGLTGGQIALPNFRWDGPGSGHAIDLLRLNVAPRIRGDVHAIFTWEGGDSFSGMIIKDGVVTDCDVVQTLVPKGTP